MEEGETVKESNRDPLAQLVADTEMVEDWLGVKVPLTEAVLQGLGV